MTGRDERVERQTGCKCHWEEGDSECPVHVQTYAEVARELAVFKGAHMQAVALATQAGRAERVRDQLRIGLLRGQLENARHTALTLCERHRCCGEFLGQHWVCPACKAICGCELCRIGRTREWYGITDLDPKKSYP